MTAIVGIETPDGVLLGADSAVGSGWFLNCTGNKLIRLGDYIIGCAGEVRGEDLVRHHLSLPEPPRTQLHRHVVTVVVPALRECLKAGGVATTKDGAEGTGEPGSMFLIGVRGHLFEIATDYAVTRAAHGYMTAGCGREIAAGALAVTTAMKPRARLRAALKAAERHSLGVRRPWRFLAEKGAS